MRTDGAPVPLRTAELGRTLADALAHEPFYRGITPDARDEQARRDVLARYFAISVEQGAALGRCEVTPDGVSGAAVWSLPLDAATAAAAHARKHDALREVLGAPGIGRYDRIVASMERLTSPFVPAGDWYLSIAGVAPEMQGRGLGARLLEPTLREADHAGVHCYLETFGDRNLGFYGRVGFVVAATLHDPETEAPYHVMTRSPRPPCACRPRHTARAGLGAAFG